MKRVLKIGSVILLMLVATFGTGGFTAAAQTDNGATPVNNDDDFSAAAATPITITVTTSDGAPVPAGTTVTAMGGVNFPAGPAGAVINPTTQTPFVFEFPGDSAYGYMFFVENVAGYENYSSAFIRGTETTTLSIVLQKIPDPTYTVDVTISTDDDGDIPAGTTYSITDSSNTVVLSGSLPADEAQPFAAQITDVPADTYTVTITNAVGYEDFTDSYIITESTSIDIELVAVAATHSLTITTEDGGNIPAGTEITIIKVDPEPSEQFYADTLTMDQPSGYTVSGLALDPEALYSVNVFSPDTYQPFASGTSLGTEDLTAFLLNLPTYTVDVTITTDDGGNIPAGTTYSITDSSNTEVLAGSLPADETQPFAAQITDVPADTYTVTITNAVGYQDFTDSYVITGNASIAIELLAIPPTPTVAPVETGNVVLIVNTEDGGDIPAGATFSIDGQDVVASSVSAADVPSGSVFNFLDVAAGTQTITASSAAPYLDNAIDVDVIAGQTTTAVMLLVLDDDATPTVVPTETATAVPTEAGATPVVPDPTKPSKPSKPTTVTTLPNTGQGQSSSSTNMMLIFGAMFVAVVAVVAAVRSRRPLS